MQQWILCAGRTIRGSKRRDKIIRRLASNETPSPSKKVKDVMSFNTASANAKPSLFDEIFSDNFDDQIWPLQLVDPKDSEQFAVLYPLLFKLPHPVMHYLHELIFPEVLAYQGLKLSTCGQELGGDMLFGRRIGFSGTPSDILPRELGSCHYERGSDGQVVHYLTSPQVVKHINVESEWTVKSILDLIATV